MGYFDYDSIFEEALYLYENDPQVMGDKAAVARFLIHKHAIDKTENAVRKAISDRMNNHYADKEIVENNVRLAKQKQKAQDVNRIERKSFREYARLENALADFAQEQLKVYKEHAKELKKIKLKPIVRSKKKSGTGVMQITDLHGNELVDLPHNKYDFNIMAKRLRLYVLQCIEDFRSRNIEKVAMLFTGDLLNSDRRLDELLNASTNRAKATSLMRYILLQAILEVRDAGFPITIVGVMGNESRAGKEMPFSKEGLSDNYDFMILDGLRQMIELSRIKGITFGSVDKVEEVVEIEGKNWLISHDVTKMTNKQDKAQSGIGRYSLQGVQIDFMIGGHIHATRVTDISARSASLVGSNSYNENALNLAGKAAQNYYICKDGRRNTTVVDLQDVEGVVGYDVIKELEAYNAKSVTKLEQGTTVFKVVI